MDQVTITVTKDIKDHIDAQVAAKKFGDANAYLCELIREERRRQSKAALEAKLLESIRSGPSVEIGEAQFEALRDELRSKATKAVVKP